MHMQGSPRTMQDNPTYQDVVAEVLEFLQERAELALTHGIPHGHIVLDPGIGFGKTLEQNLALLRAIPRLTKLGYPVLIGLSRKSFIAAVSGAPVADRLPGSLVGAVHAAQSGAAVVRVHDVAATKQALEIAQALHVFADNCK
jgi:dihydropteroate synthase